jgi:hypothetical protein
MQEPAGYGRLSFMIEMKRRWGYFTASTSLRIIGLE